MAIESQLCPGSQLSPKDDQIQQLLAKVAAQQAEIASLTQGTLNLNSRSIILKLWLN